MQYFKNLIFQKSIGYRYVSIKNAPNASFMGLARLNWQLKNCNLCELCKHRTNAVISTGQAARGSIMLLAESPDINDDASGVAQMGDISDILRDIVGADGRIFKSYLLKCRPKNQPNEAHFSQCFGYFQSEFEAIRPRLIVAFGEVVFRRLNPNFKGSFTSACGGIFSYQNSTLLAVQSPLMIAKNPSQKAAFLEALAKIKGYL